MDWLIRSTRLLKQWRAVSVSVSVSVAVAVAVADADAVTVHGGVTEAGGATVGRRKDVQVEVQH